MSALVPVTNTQDYGLAAVAALATVAGATLMYQGTRGSYPDPSDKSDDALAQKCPEVTLGDGVQSIIGLGTFAAGGYLLGRYFSMKK